MDEHPQVQDDEPVSPQPAHGYASVQLALAWTAFENLPDEKSRANARVKIDQWTKTIAGMADGSIAVGSRAPLASTPVWATLEVITGGFATGALVAGGPLQGHETALMAELNIAPGENVRHQLNAFFLSEPGIARLNAQLESGCYDINCPEEGALLAAAWLLTHGKADQARELIEHIAPWFGQLRFFPVPSPQARQLGTRLCLATVQDVIESLSMMVPKNALARQARAIRVRLPLYDRMVSLFLETVEGAPPRIEPDVSGAWTDPVSRKFLTAGGWPCRHYAADWKVRAQELLGEVDRVHSAASSGIEGDADSFAQLRTHLRNCLRSPEALTGREVGRIRLLLARYISKRGEPGSAAWMTLRASQLAQVNTLDHHVVADLVKARLGEFPGDQGLDDFVAAVQPVTQVEAQRWHIDCGTAVPKSIRRKVARSRIDTVQMLVHQGAITSSEMLATILPQISSDINAAGIAERSARQLYGAIYQAFRRRRSLLLLNLQKQVQLEELPWIAPLDALREKGGAPADLARKTLEDIVLLTLTSFPHTVVPNKLLQELRALAKAADVKLPLVEELAVDIFAGDFSGKFIEAAQFAAVLLEESIYGRYYGIDTQQVQPPATPQKRGIVDTIVSTMRPERPGKDFLRLCESRAGVKYASYTTVTNGMLIEQQQILTTQNLAVLVGGLNMQSELKAVAGSLARQCFAWICSQLQLKRTDWHGQLIARKNSAYAWRQMIFFLALEPADATQSFLDWASEYLDKQPPAFGARFAPALAGLKLAAQGKALDGDEAVVAKAHRFLAYSQGPHWL